METILRQFVPFERLASARPFGNGHINDTYKIVVEAGGTQKAFLLQRFNDRVFGQPETVMDNISAVAHHLSVATDYPWLVLKPYRAKNGGWLFHDENGHYWRVFDFFENTRSFDVVSCENQAFEAAKAYGAFARALANMDLSALHVTIPGFHDGEKRLADFKTTVAEAQTDPRRAKRLTEAKQEVAFLLSNQSVLKKEALPPLPLRATHHDTKLNNVLFDKKTIKAVAVVDLDTVMPGTVLSDFGDIVRTFTPTVTEDHKEVREVAVRPHIYRAVSEGFLSELADVLTPQERHSLPFAGPWLTLMQAVRFVTDYLLGDRYYKTKYPGHNLVRTQNQIALFQSLQQSLHQP
ncbi:MAG TPA: aminoglycoside phosphotransferase family protein [Bacteroidetes bacterium]|nr:aminoglycoside phosphotransferase family protein [Bacteroidota bacterium]